MAIITFDQTESLPDPLTGDHFNFILGTVPLGGDTSPLIIKCADAIIPGFGTEAVEMNVGAQTRKVRGRKTFPRTMNITYYEDITMNTLMLLRRWSEAVVGSNSGSSIGNIAEYSVLALLQVFDQANRLIDSIEFENCFPMNVSDTSLNSESTQLVRISAEFSYDRATFANSPAL